DQILFTQLIVLILLHQFKDALSSHTIDLLRILPLLDGIPDSYYPLLAIAGLVLPPTDAWELIPILLNTAMSQDDFGRPWRSIFTSVVGRIFRQIPCDELPERPFDLLMDTLRDVGTVPTELFCNMPLRAIFTVLCRDPDLSVFMLKEL